MTLANLLYVGTYTEPIRFGTGQILQGKGKGIHWFQYDAETGQLSERGVLEGVRNPSYLCFDKDRRYLYAVNELKEFEGQFGGGVSAFRVDQDTGGLTYLNSQPTRGTDPCHLIVDPAGGHVLVANFMSGSVCVLPIMADGSLGEETDFIQHEGSSINPQRQAGPHAHAVEFDAAGRFCFVPELGLDKVMIYRFDPRTGKLSPAETPWVSVKPGAGPRQLVMHPRGGFAYLINELNCTMTSYRYDAASGALHELQTLPTLPADFSGHSSCAEVQISPDGRYLYGSNRGHDSLAIYRLDEDGGMEAIGHVPTGGRIPRNFEVHPSGRLLCAANQDSDNLVMFRIDSSTGRPEPMGQTAMVGTPICVRFA
jgi:6-phosphogluconolactonase